MLQREKRTMSKITFIYENYEAAGRTAPKSLRLCTEEIQADALFEEFKSFLLAIGFQPDTIERLGESS